MNKAIIGILMIMLMTNTLALNSTDTICRKTYYFILNNLDYNNTLTYTSGDLENLKNSIATEINDTNFTISGYVSDFKEQCKNTQYSLPYNFRIGTIDLQENKSSECNIYIDREFLGYDLDTSLSLFKIYKQHMECNSIQTYKYIFDIQKEDIGYSLKGIKLYVIVLPMILVVGYYIYKQNRQLNKHLKRMVS